MPAPTHAILSGPPQRHQAWFGGQPLPGTGVTSTWLDLNDGKSSHVDILKVRVKPEPKVEITPLPWRARGATLGTDFAAKKVTIPMTYNDAPGTLLGTFVAQLEMAGEQYLTFDGSTYLLARLSSVGEPRARKRGSPYFYDIDLAFIARDPWTYDIQPSGSLTNLLNPYGGVEGPAVQPTLYGSNVMQSLDFETGGATTDLFHSIGTEALGTLAAWLQTAGNTANWAIAANVISVTLAVNGRCEMTGGHLDWADGTFWTRMVQPAAGGTLGLTVGRDTAGFRLGNSIEIQATSGGGNLLVGVNKIIGGTLTTVLSSTTLGALAPGTQFWLRVVRTGTTVTVAAFADNPAGTVSTQIGTTQTVTIADAAVANGQIALVAINGSGAGNITFSMGGAFANVCYVTGPCPTGCAFDLNGGTWGTRGEPALCWSNKQAYYGTSSLSVSYAQASAGGPGAGWTLPSAGAGSGLWQINAWIKNTNANTSGWQASGAGVAPAVTGTTWASSANSVTNPGGVSVVLRATSGAGGGGTVYFDYVTVVVPTIPTGVLFNSVGAALGGFTPTGTLNAWTLGAGPPAIAGNVVSLPATSSMGSAHADLWDYTAFARFTYTDNSAFSLALRTSGNASASTDCVEFHHYGLIPNAHFQINKFIGNVQTVLNDQVVAFNAGSQYWIKGQATGTSFTFTLYKDAGGYIADQVATATVTVTDASVQTGRAGIRNLSSIPTSCGGNFPGAFLVQGPRPTAWSPIASSGEPAFCWSKTAPYGGVYSLSIYTPVNLGSGFAAYWQGPSAIGGVPAVPYTVSAALKSSSSAISSDVRLWGSTTVLDLASINDGAWHVVSVTGTEDGNPPFIAFAMLAGTGTVYCDNVVVQKTNDATTGQYASAFVDQVPVVGSPGAGTSTIFALNYLGTIWAEPKLQFNIPANSNITQIKIQNTSSTDPALTLNFTALTAALTLTVDSFNPSVTDQNGVQYDFLGSFPALYPGNNSFTVTIVTSSGTVNLTLDSRWQNRWAGAAA